MAFFKKTPNEPDSKIPDEIAELRNSLLRAGLPDHVAPLVDKEISKLERTDPSLAEYTIGIGYIEFVISLPWNRFTSDNLDITRAQGILDQSHFGLSQVKERIVEYLAVRTLKQSRIFNILVTDDEELARLNMQHVITKLGHHVDVASNGIEALEKLSSRNYDLLITDLKMEKMSGQELLERAEIICPSLDIVMVTGFATIDSAVSALSKGATHYLAKPFKIDELRSVVTSILERKRATQFTRGPILCFSGPPGTGKTSIGKAIAESMERKFVRLSLAGMRDEAELRGHRRAYVGAMPGRIIMELKRLGVANPVFMLDEIDKIGQDFKGDPASVLLEILDPEQNRNFVDYYLDVPFDLSSVMFICTANLVDRLPMPLLDRLEIIEFNGYTLEEKKRIASKYLVPRQLEANGLQNASTEFSPEAITSIINNFTQEAGLRNLEREIANICRKVARITLETKESQTVTVTSEKVVQYLGPPKFRHEKAEEIYQVGSTTGLVWTEFGGEIITVESTKMKGLQQLILTGSLGNILRESAQTALSYIRSNAQKYLLDPDFFRSMDIHIHIPAAAVPKDGPSAGITILMSLLSLLTGMPAKRTVALSGEITLNGKLLPVSGIREKVLAAQRAGVEIVVFPAENQPEISLLSEDLKTGLDIRTAHHVSELETLVLVKGTT